MKSDRSVNCAHPSVKIPMKYAPKSVKPESVQRRFACSSTSSTEIPKAVRLTTKQLKCFQLLVARHFIEGERKHAVIAQLI